MRTSVTEIHQAKGGGLIKKKDEILPFVTTRIDFEGFMLSEISQMEKDKYHII